MNKKSEIEDCVLTLQEMYTRLSQMRSIGSSAAEKELLENTFTHLNHSISNLNSIIQIKQKEFEKEIEARKEKREQSQSITR